MVLIQDPAQWRRTRGLTLPPGFPPVVLGVLNQQNLFKKGFVYSGRCPASRPHLGHLVGWEAIRTYAEASGSAIHFMVSDDQASRVKAPGGTPHLEQNLKALQTYFREHLTLVFNSGTQISTDLLYDTCSLYRHVGQWQALFGTAQGRASLQLIVYSLIQTSYALKLSRERPTTVFAGADQYPFFAKLRGVPDLAVVLLDAVPDLLSLNKMSGSSSKGCLYLTDTPEQIARKVKSARTAAGTLEHHRTQGVGPDDPLLSIFRLRGLECADYACGKIDVVTFKLWAAEEIKYLLAPFTR